ncbi:DEAD/DEAH box helicase [Clostridium oceanicum]|uniref:RNA helicase n=1 Tax=Clostridium oceanicum TaxID=1543 RepID=A0ABN1JJD1_9CLOT
MKKTAVNRDYIKIKKQFNNIEQIVKNTKPNSLWEHEAAVRKKIKFLKEIRNKNLRDFNEVYNKYMELLDYISIKLVDNYNKRNNTSFDFYEIVKMNKYSYLKSGIINVLISKHIPFIVSREFKKVFPENPKDEYKKTRKIKRKFYLHLGETNTGKTYNSMERLKKCKKGIYLSPLRILALENYEKLNKEGVKCSLLTGEEEIQIEGAKHISSTVEKLNTKEEYDVAIIDEIQMIGDDQRGNAWTRAVLALKSKEIHICGAANVKDLIIKIIEDCEDEYELIEYKRNIELKVQEKSFRYKDVEEGDALVAFSKKKVLDIANYYKNIGVNCSIIYGDLPPEVRIKQYEKFINKKANVLVTTDAIGMGVNLPIKRIVFMDIKKFDGNEFRYLTSQEVKQIAGRAGRKGIYDVGYVAGYKNTGEFIKEMIETEDYPINEAVLGPSEAILKVKNLSLKEKLALWSTKKEKLDFYRKMDVEKLVFLLDSIKFYNLKEEIQWKLLKIPFDVTSKVLMGTFLSYIDELFIGKHEKLLEPKCLIKDLQNLEIYYEQIDLYYSFSKVFNLELDVEWVYKKRIEISKEINNILRKNITLK